MSSLAALYFSYMPPPPTPEELEAIRLAALEAERKRLEQEEREKHAIFSIQQFERLSRVEGESGAIGVKILRDSKGVLYWMNTNTYLFHYIFCMNVLNEKRTVLEFNEQFYTGKDRTVIPATVMAYPAPNNQRYCCLELNPADPMTNLEVLKEFFEEVKKSFMDGKEALYFHPTSEIQVAALANKQIPLPIITSDTLFGGLKYKLVQPGRIPKCKRIRVFAQKTYTQEDLNKWMLARTLDDIVVIPCVPNNVPPVAAVICGEIIPPLCHVALLCQNRKTPCCFVKGCVDLFEGLGELVGHGVVAKTGYFVDATKQGQVHYAEKPKFNIQKTDPNVTAVLIDIHEDKTYATDTRVVGAKAAQLAKVESIYSQPIFKGTFVVPFRHYNKHVFRTAEISKMIKTIHDHMKDSEVSLGEMLRGKKEFDYNEYAQVQEAIQNQPVDPELVLSIIDKIKQNNMTSVIFRSSTNTEDLPGFNGAGLYDSVPLIGESSQDPVQVEAAIKKVWASVWNPLAVKERDHYQIAYKHCHIAILVQPFISDQTPGIKVHYNGVCITHDVVRHKVKHGFMLSWYEQYIRFILKETNMRTYSFPGSGLRATNFYKSKVPEQTMIVLGRETNSIDLQVMNTGTGLTHSLVTPRDAEKMLSVFGSLHTSILNKPHKIDDTLALDIEFMVIDNDKATDKREIVVLQARPYTVNVMTTDELEQELQLFASTAGGPKMVCYYSGTYNYQQKGYDINDPRTW